MRIRTAVAAVVTVLISAGCSGPSPQGEDAPGDPVTPFDAVERAQDVADSVEQRQADLEAQMAELMDPFSNP